MTQNEKNTLIQNAYTEYRKAKEALTALETSCVEIATTSSITTEEGYWMYSPSGFRLFETGYVREQVARYRAAKEHKEALRNRLTDLGEPDPE